MINSTSDLYERKSKSHRLEASSMRGRRATRRVNVNDLEQLRARGRGGRKRVKRTLGRKSKERRGVVRVKKNRVSLGAFYERTIYRGEAHASIVHNKCHSNDARGFYEEPAIVSLDLHGIDKNMEHLAFESSRGAPTTRSIALLFQFLGSCTQSHGYSLLSVHMHI